MTPLRLLDEPPDVLAVEQAWVEVPGGRFVMGNGAGRPDEQPPHPVSVRAIEVAVVPVTNRQYQRFLDATGHEPPRFAADERFNHADQPVVAVNWYDAVDYCEWLSRASGRLCRLPTEAEREWFSLGGATTRFPWGDDEPEQVGPFARGARGQDRPLRVAAVPPNGFGLYDTAYNVHEWCSDWYDARYYVDSPGDDPRGPETGTRRASRGGAWRHDTKVTRCTARSSLNPQLRYNDYSFRVVREL